MESQNLTEISLRDLARKLREYATDAMRSPIDVSYEKAGNYALFLEIYRKDNFQILGAGLVIQIGCAVQFLEQMVQESRKGDDINVENIRKNNALSLTHLEAVIRGLENRAYELNSREVKQ